MEFLMAAFKRQLEGYGYNFTLECVGNHLYSLEFIDIPVKLDVILCKMKYKRYIRSEGANDYFDEVNVCTPITKDSHRIIHVNFDESTYAKKINMIDHAIRMYHDEANSVYIR